nr:DTW domain-containing protein [Marinibactrum halimedae]
MAAATKPFKARGVSVQRCLRCQLKMHQCLCQWRLTANSPVDFILILHRKEVLKPTNTGRLIADTFPKHTYVFEWNRTEPPVALLQLLQSPERDCRLIFPKTDMDNTAESSPMNNSNIGHKKRTTLVILDGSWREAKKMYAKSPWLKSVPLLDIGESIKQHQASNQYTLRQAPKEQQLSTVEAMILAIHALEHHNTAEVLHDYYDVFHSLYSALRSNTQPNVTAAHARIRKRQASLVTEN